MSSNIKIKIYIKELHIIHYNHIIFIIHASGAFVKQTGEGLSRSFASLDFAPFAEKDSFVAFNLEFAVETRLGAVITRCAERLLPGPGKQVTQRQMEKVLFL